MGDPSDMDGLEAAGMTDYRGLIDAETWAFIERSESFYPPDAASLSIDGNRNAYDAMCRAFDAGRPEGVGAEDRAIEGNGGPLPVRLYRAADRDDVAAIVYFPDRSMFIIPIPVPIPAPLFAVGYLAYSYYAAKNPTGRINHDAHFAGALTGLAFVALTDLNAYRYLIGMLFG